MKYIGIALLKLFGALLFFFGVVPIMAESFAYLIAIADAVNGNELSWPDHALPAVAHVMYPIAAFLGATIIYPPLLDRLRAVIDAIRRRPSGDTREEKTRE